MSTDVIVDPSRVLGPDPRAHGVRGAYIEHLSGGLNDRHVSEVTVGAMVTEELGSRSRGVEGGEQLVVVKSSQMESSRLDANLRERNEKFQAEAVVLHVGLTLPEGASQYENLIPSAIYSLNDCLDEIAEPNAWVAIEGAKYPARSICFGGARTTVSDPDSRLSFSIFRYGSGVTPVPQLSSFRQRGEELGIKDGVYERSESDWRRLQVVGRSGKLHVEELHLDYLNLLNR